MTAKGVLLRLFQGRAVISSHVPAGVLLCGLYDRLWLWSRCPYLPGVLPSEFTVVLPAPELGHSRRLGRCDWVGIPK